MRRDAQPRNGRRAAVRCALACGLAGLLGTRAVAQPAVDSLTAVEQSLQPTVETLRGLRFVRPIPVEVVNDSVARVHFVDRLDTYSPAARLQATSLALAQLGLLPPGTDLRHVLLDVLEEQAGGYYDPETEKFYVLGDMPGAAVPIIMVHELTHALDDQHFGIDSLLAAIPADDDDAQSAASAVVEGSGTLVMTAYVVRELAKGGITAEALTALQASEAGRAARLRQAPALLRRMLLAPYVLGQSFLLRGHPERIVDGIETPDLDHAFRAPPGSTEQLLHADKYWDPARVDPPRAVPEPGVAAILGHGWTRVGSGTLGELIVALLTGAEDPPLDALDVTLPERWTTPAVAGWGGDRWWLYSDGRHECTVLCTVWDDAAAARTFRAALHLPAGCRVERRGESVTIVAGAPPGRAGAILRACGAAALPRTSP
jgi:hypothetical protein